MTNNMFFKERSPMTKWQKTATHTSAHKAANFNALHKPGTLVKVRDGMNAHITTRTKGEAFTVSRQFACIQVKFQDRYFLLQETQVLPETSTDKETPEP